QQKIDDWTTRTEGQASTYHEVTITAEANKVYRFRLDYIHTGTPGWFEIWTSGPGIQDTSGVGLGANHLGFLSPDYGLTTSSTTYDAQTGNSTTNTSYGSNPELSLAQSVTENYTNNGQGNGTGNDQNLTTNFSYEQQGATGSYLRQTAKYLPGANTASVSTATQYGYYGATETRDNPCTTTTTEAYKQAGMLKLKTEPDPDGTGSQTSRTSESIYDDSGSPVATRLNGDAWSCTTYDVRGRTAQTVVQPLSGKPGRTITNNYAVGGNPLVTSSTDEQGTITIQNDLLGRTIGYTDANGNQTTYTYDSLGDMTSRTSTMGLEEWAYDSLNRQTTQKLDGVVLAQITYDQYSRQSSVSYPTAGQAKLSAIGRDSLQRNNSLSYTLGDGTTGPSDQVTRSQTGDILSGTENGLTKSYTYDGSGRLTNATIGSNTYGYSYATTTSAQCSQSAANLSAAKNGNRTSMTVNGVATTYCYNYADQLISSSDTKVTNAQYDSHGNTTSLGNTTVRTEFGYDVSDRNISIYQADTNKTITYERDSQNRIKHRTSSQNGTNSSDSLYGFTGSGDTPDFIKNTSGQVTEKYIQLAGGVILTIRPNDPIAAKQKTYSLPNIHGDVFATLDSNGALISTHTTGPFGERITGQTSPANTVQGASYSYVGSNEKLTESDLALQPTEMGARVYIATLGRFLQVDPQEGGTDNNYVYAVDPVNEFDLDGNAINWRKIGKVAVIAASVAGAIACGASVVCGVAVGAAAGAASYAVAKGGTKQFSVKGMAGSAVIGGALGAVSGVGQAAAKGFKIAQAAKLGKGNYSLGTANRTTSAFAGRFFTNARTGLNAYRAPALKKTGQVAANFERFIKKPTSNTLRLWPNRIGNGHLTIKGWW
ncbi:MAG TPA: RHS repeat-associated core domain-containing protein, partial [Patescibacteria group bacterium]|nr:RHS repeat-associated core domain-containing protein [Patescibacteria group bacterium]